MPPLPIPGPAPLPRDAIRALLERLSILQTLWSPEKRPMLGMIGGGKPQAYMVLTLGRIRANPDDYRTQLNPDTNELDASLGGYRVLSISCRVVSIDTVRAYPDDVLERVRWGFGTKATQAELMAAKLAFVRHHPIATFETKEDSRVVMNGVMDLQLARVAVAAPTGDSGDFVETVNTDFSVPIDLE